MPTSPLVNIGQHLICVSQYMLALNIIGLTEGVPVPIMIGTAKCVNIESNLVISNSLISNYRLARSENLVPVLT